jgi:PhnB protein
MKEMNGYLNFDGDTRDAMKFYQRCLGGELLLSPFSEVKMDVPPEAKDRIVHSKLTAGSFTLMASDLLPGMPFQKGTNFHICLSCESGEETERLYNALGEKGKVTMALQDMFWGARFGMVVDQFGVSWMFNYDKPKGI